MAKQRTETIRLDDNLLSFVTSKSKEKAGLTWLGHDDPYFHDRSVVTELRLQFDCQVWMSDVLEVVHGTSAEDYLFYPLYNVRSVPVTLNWPVAFGLTLKVGPAFWQRFDDYLADQESRSVRERTFGKRIAQLEEKTRMLRKQLRSVAAKKGKK